MRTHWVSNHMNPTLEPWPKVYVLRMVLPEGLVTLRVAVGALLLAGYTG